MESVYDIDVYLVYLGHIMHDNHMIATCITYFSGNLTYFPYTITSQGTRWEYVSTPDGHDTRVLRAGDAVTRAPSTLYLTAGLAY